VKNPRQPQRRAQQLETHKGRHATARDGRQDRRDVVRQVAIQASGISAGIGAYTHMQSMDAERGGRMCRRTSGAFVLDDSIRARSQSLYKTFNSSKNDYKSCLHYCHS
jgi:hypothetical protein